MMPPDGWRWTKAAPTLFPAFEPSEKRRISLPGGFGLRKTRSGLKFALVGSEGRLCGVVGAREAMAVASVRCRLH